MRNELIVVCGLARCGTSLMMKMLHKGGIEPLCDPESLHHGYELHATTWLPDQTAWLRDTAFILLTRDFREQSKSHIKFVKALGVPVKPGARGAIEKSLRRDLPVVRRLLASYSQARLLSLTFEDILDDPLGSERLLDDFLERSDFDMLKAAQCVLKRSPKCLPYLLETEAAKIWETWQTTSPQ